MPHLVQMDKKYSKKGMVLIGAEVQGSAEDKINEIIDEHKVQFTVTKGIIGPNLSNSIPHMAVFAANGDLVFNGHPNNAEKVIKTALKDVKEDPSTTESSLFAKPKYLINERIWTNTEGKTLKAALISMEGQVGKFRFSNGRTFNYDITKLSADDQTLIKEKSGKESEDEGTEELDDRFQF
tara:strand:+ start:64 stop:606 length:543 start_codon:yes stop_codon:yes gene_type:complete